MVLLDAPAPGDAGATAAAWDGATAPSDGAQAVAAATATAQIRAETDLPARTPVGVVVGVVVGAGNGGRRCVDICLATLREAAVWSG
ncbi:hypothetical protein Misp03_55730 [Microbispora sp. NBRC 16548]|nr:hypothetical protein Misp03_55730 [Microbispora sp. NBRC 16548]